ncbi:hypothetical protein F4813DRAFT_376900 [Daldinia decipiens]|uniref:uncharacterized protein n=1 Tax=Daldinia decipiens TaxID=326647 RepID=UPI0020C24177|nr:uncharacterized protein F4813DRAFT_376900 [Daldinia decipiens]KAI1652726.1 hypothetical protein F4813DRAFT_376900 [Daldinia decipiens]
MHDLSGLKVALYYPNDFEKVERVIQERFVEVKPPQDWPDRNYGAFHCPTLDEGISGQNEIMGRRSWFSGYFARHYRLKLKDRDVTEPAVKDRVAEIQLMSLLMHAWAKIHHEPIYKPKNGPLHTDEDDERLLDISNGIIIAGEQVLRQIQINLDKKSQQGQIPFKNIHDAWSYLEENWAKGGTQGLSSYERGAAYESTHVQILYRTLETLEFRTPEKLDILVKYCLALYPNCLTPPGAYGDCDFIDMLIISLVEIGDFKAVESEQLQLPLSDSLYLSRSETLKLVRYNAITICHALRHEKLASTANPIHIFEGLYPSSQEFLAMIHPRASLAQSPESLVKVRDFCDYLLRWEDLTWKLHCAISRLTWIRLDVHAWGTLGDGLQAYEYAIPVCDSYLIEYLDIYRDIDLPKNKAAPQLGRVIFRPLPTVVDGVGIWTKDIVRASVVMTQLGFLEVRQYLERPDAM